MGSRDLQGDVPTQCALVQSADERTQIEPMEQGIFAKARVGPLQSSELSQCSLALRAWLPANHSWRSRQPNRGLEEADYRLLLAT